MLFLYFSLLFSVAFFEDRKLLYSMRTGVSRKMSVGQETPYGVALWLKPRAYKEQSLLRRLPVC